VETYGFEEKSEKDINEEKESERKRRAKKRENNREKHVIVLGIEKEESV
jgi:hypothetical protein